MMSPRDEEYRMNSDSQYQVEAITSLDHIMPPDIELIDVVMVN